MPPRRWTMSRKPQLTAGLRHFVEHGCYFGGDGRNSFCFDSFLLAAMVNRGTLVPLAALWAIYGADVKRARNGGDPFADVVLAGGRWEWPSTSWHCPEHETATKRSAAAGDRRSTNPSGAVSRVPRSRGEIALFTRHTHGEETTR